MQSHLFFATEAHKFPSTLLLSLFTTCLHGFVIFFPSLLCCSPQAIFSSSFLWELRCCGPDECVGIEEQSGEATAGFNAPLRSLYVQDAPANPLISPPLCLKLSPVCSYYCSWSAFIFAPQLSLCHPIIPTPLTILPFGIKNICCPCSASSCSGALNPCPLFCSSRPRSLCLGVSAALLFSVSCPSRSQAVVLCLPGLLSWSAWFPEVLERNRSWQGDTLRKASLTIPTERHTRSHCCSYTTAQT